jgi:hypothetical protein
MKMLIAALLCASVPIAGEAAPNKTLREFLDSQRSKHTALTIELIDGATISGPIARTDRRRFYVLDKNGMQGQAIAYSDVRALIDYSAGEHYLVQRLPAPHAHRHVSLKGLLIAAGIVVGALIVLEAGLSGG